MIEVDNVERILVHQNKGVLVEQVDINDWVKLARDENHILLDISIFVDKEAVKGVNASRIFFKNFKWAGRFSLIRRSEDDFFTTPSTRIWPRYCAQ